MDEIKKYLFSLKDEEYGDFEKKLIPNLFREEIVGIRAPLLKKYAKDLVTSGLGAEFLKDLPHRYLEENHLHAYIINLERDFDRAVGLCEEFLPYVNNWATCDSLNPPCFGKNKGALLEKVRLWLKSRDVYAVRFAVACLMRHFLGCREEDIALSLVAEIRSEEYYINMMCAWFYATALCKCFDKAVRYLEMRALEKWVHNKAISKGVESFRLKSEQKEYIKTLKIK